MVEEDQTRVQDFVALLGRFDSVGLPKDMCMNGHEPAKADGEPGG